MARACLHAIYILLAIVELGCQSRPAPAAPTLDATCEKPLPQARIFAIATEEASRLLEQRLHTRGRIGHVSAPEQSGVWLVIVGFENPTDTAAEVRVEACTGIVLSSSIGGGL